MPAKPISFDSDMRREAKYQTGWMSIAVTISNRSASNVVPIRTKRNKRLAVWVKKKIKGKKRDVASAQEGLCAPISSSFTSLPLSPLSPFPPEPFGEKMSNDHASVSTIWQLVHL